MTAGPAGDIVPVPPAPAGEDSTVIAQSLYERNAELGVKNKTLSLLGQLYATSILALTPKELAKQLSDALRDGLTCELVILFGNDAETKLTALAASVSERSASLMGQATVDLAAATLPLVSTPFLQEVVGKRTMRATANLDEVWPGALPPATVQALKDGSHVKSALAYPLVGGDRALGVVVFVLNREPDQFSTFEKTLFDSSVNVVSVALEKSLLYEAVQEANHQLQDLSRFKSQLLSLASHQIKAPLAAIKGYISLVQEGGYGEVPENLKKPIASMQRSANGLVELITSLLDLRRIEEGKMEYAFDKVDLAEMVRDVVDELGMLAREKSLQLTLAGADNPVYVRADKTKLRQVVQNLVDNSIKYTPNGSVNVVLSTEGRYVTCTVSDTGLGMAPALLPRLFDEFTRDQRVEHTIRGTGLGLYIAKRIIEAHGGSVQADSPGEGKGSRFWFTLPIEQ